MDLILDYVLRPCYVPSFEESETDEGGAVCSDWDAEYADAGAAGDGSERLKSYHDGSGARILELW